MTAAFGEVADIEFDLLIPWAVSDCKVEPVDVASCVRVDPEEQVVFGVGYFDCAI